MSTLSKRDLLKKEHDLDLNTNPAKKFFKWESDNKTFSYYDKEEKENVLIELPLEFVLIGKPLIAIKGYNSKLKKWFYSNEVQSINDELTVRYYDKNIDPIAVGKWKDIKETVDVKGAKYHLSIYGYNLIQKEIINISIKGLGVGEWYDLQKNWGNRLADEIVSIKSYKDGKSGSNSFTYPSFSLKRSISDDELDEVFDALTTLKSYLKKYFVNYGINVNEIEVVEPEFVHADNDIDF